MADEAKESDTGDDEDTGEASEEDEWAAGLTKAARISGVTKSLGCHRVSMDILNSLPWFAVAACIVRISNKMTSPFLTLAVAQSQ